MQVIALIAHHNLQIFNPKYPCKCKSSLMSS